MKKVLFILTQPFDPYSGGVQMSTYKISKYLSNNGFNTAVYSFSNKVQAKQSFTTLYHSERAEGQFNSENLENLSLIIQSYRPDVVINQMPYEHTISNVLSENKDSVGYLLLGCLRNTLYSVKLNLDSYRRKVIPTAVQPLFNNVVGKKLLLIYHWSKHRSDLKKILDIYDFFIMFGPPNIKELQYFVGNYKNEKKALIPNTIPEVLPVVPPKEKRILWLSRLSYEQKRSDLILPLWKEIKDQLPDWHFDIVGNGNAFEDLKNQIELQKLSRITLHGKQKPDEFYKRSPIYIMTSAFEGFPNTLIEAQSFGSIPVVFNNYPILNWVIEDCNSGYLIEPFDIQAMGSKIVELATDSNKQMNMSKAALENADRFTIERVGQQWQKLFAMYVKQ